MVETIVVIGGAGYIGSVLTQILLDRGFAVRVLDNFSFSETGLLGCCAHPHFEVIRGDCRDRTTVARAVAGADYILPLAALVGAPPPILGVGTPA